MGSNVSDPPATRDVVGSQSRPDLLLLLPLLLVVLMQPALSSTASRRCVSVRRQELADLRDHVRPTVGICGIVDDRIAKENDVQHFVP